MQKVGDDRIVVELPGIDDRARAEALVQSSAFLQFQITDKTQALEKALGRIDAAVNASGRDGARRGQEGHGEERVAAQSLLGCRQRKGEEGQRGQADTIDGGRRRADRSPSSFSRDRCRASISSRRTTCPRCRAISIARKCRRRFPRARRCTGAARIMSAGNASYAHAVRRGCAADHHGRVSDGREARRRIRPRGTSSPSR